MKGDLKAELQTFERAAGVSLAGLDKAEFSELLELYPPIFVMEAETSRGKVPVGYVQENRVAGLDHMIIPHFVWFGWASARNRFESVMKFVNEMRREATVIGYTKMSEHDFWMRLSDYGVVKCRGQIPGWFDLATPCEMWVGR